MNVRSTASRDAFCRSPGFDAEGEVYWLQPRSVPQTRSDGTSGRVWLLRVTSGLGLGALLTLGSASTALAPALANTPATGEPPTAGEAAAQIDQPQTLSSPVSIRSGVAPEQTGAKTVLELHLPAIEPIEAAPNPIRVEASVTPVALADDEAMACLLASASIDDQLQLFLDGPRVRDPGEFLHFDEMRVPRWIVETILRASEVTGVDPVYMMALADKESSFLPANKASTSSAEGLFQFISSTWLDVVKRFGAMHGLAEEAAAIQTVNGQLSVPDETVRERILGLRRDPYISALMAAEMMKQDRATMERRVGRPITRSEFYLAHFFGVDSASKFVSLLDGKPKQSAPRVFPAAAKANKSLFFAKKGRKTRQLTVAEVYGKIDRMIDRRLDRYGDVAMIATTADSNL
jgi:hypothetical protein